MQKATAIASPTRTRATQGATVATPVNNDLTYTPPTAKALWLLTRAQRTLDDALDAALSSTGVTWTQYSVLEVIATAKMPGGISSASVARRLKVAAQSTQPIVANLEEDGLIVRTPPGIGHGRVMFISLTPAGLECYNRAKRIIRTFERKLGARLGEPQFQGLLGYLELLISELDQASA